MKKVLIACEESQAVTIAFRRLGFEAFSCDILPSTGGHPEWHYQQDVFEVINKGWDLMIAHPPCTYLSVSGAKHLYNKDGSPNEERYNNQRQALLFIKQLMDANIKHIAIENPISVISTKLCKPDQIVQPYWFGDSASKSTCLWLKNLPKLEPTDMVDKGQFKEWIGNNGKTKKQPMWYYEALTKAKTTEERRGLRSKTFQGIADAMANQWGNYILNQ